MAKASRKKKEEKEEGIAWLDGPAVFVEGLKWLSGSGPLPAKYLFVGEKPAQDDVANTAVYSGAYGKYLRKSLNVCGFNCESVYLTNAIKYYKETTNAGDIKTCSALLREEIARCKPEVIVCFGSKALQAVVKKEYTLSTIRGEFVPFTLEDGRVIRVFATYSPSYMTHEPKAEGIFLQDIQTLANDQKGVEEVTDVTDFVVINTVEHLRMFCDMMLSREPKLITLDCEWHGCTWMYPDRYIRTVQLGYDIGKAVVIEFFDEHKNVKMDNPEEAWKVLKAFLENPNVVLGGHNAIADGEWLLSMNIDIRPNLTVDSMLLEYVINETGPFGLDDLTAKYTKMGHYERDVEMFVRANKIACKHGYGPVPAALLNVYGAKDVDATYRSICKQLPLLHDYMKPRGQHGEYPSLWQTTMQTQRNLYELEMSGLKVDQDRLKQLIESYQGRKEFIRAQVVQMAAQLGVPDFNPSSIEQVRDLMFTKLGLTPIKTTDGESWEDAVSDEGIDSEEDINAAADKVTLEILQDAHPLVRTLLYFRRLETACKVQLKYAKPEDDPSTKGGGIQSKIWPDGKLHAHFSQLTNTGRFTHSKPNVANWSKKAEGYMEAIFGSKELMPPMIRTIIVPEEGHLLMEGDFQQAELFVLAGLSGDENMWSALTTPGRDLHDSTAISAFQIQMFDPENKRVPEEYLISLAKRDMDAFKALQDKLTYVDNKGKRLSRAAFKAGVRVGAKSINFGVPYGISAREVALKIKAETGTDTPLDQLEAEVETMMSAWKTETYPTAWNYMLDCAARVTDPGYVENPWGRRRRFPSIIPRGKLNGYKRQAQNFPIQSTVADTAMLAMQLMVEYRRKHNLHFKIVNQIHDALMIEVPEKEVDACKQMYLETMGAIDIPISATKTLRLGVDVEVMTRWGEKQKKSK